MVLSHRGSVGTRDKGGSDGLGSGTGEEWWHRPPIEGKIRVHCVGKVGEGILDRGDSTWRDRKTWTSMVCAGNSK